MLCRSTNRRRFFTLLSLPRAAVLVRTYLQQQYLVPFLEYVRTRYRIHTTYLPIQYCCCCTYRYHSSIVVPGTSDHFLCPSTSTRRSKIVPEGAVRRKTAVAHTQHRKKQHSQPARAKGHHSGTLCLKIYGSIALNNTIQKILIIRYIMVSSGHLVYFPAYIGIDLVLRIWYQV